MWTFYFNLMISGAVVTNVQILVTYTEAVHNISEWHLSLNINIILHSKTVSCKFCPFHCVVATLCDPIVMIKRAFAPKARKHLLPDAFSVKIDPIRQYQVKNGSAMMEALPSGAPPNY